MVLPARLFSYSMILLASLSQKIWSHSSKEAFKVLTQQCEYHHIQNCYDWVFCCSDLDLIGLEKPSLPMLEFVLIALRKHSNSSMGKRDFSRPMRSKPEQRKLSKMNFGLRRVNFDSKVRSHVAGSHYDSQATNRKQGGLPMRDRPPPHLHLLVGLESYMTPSWLECTKTPPQTGGNSCFLIQKSQQKHFLIKTLDKI